MKTFTNLAHRAFKKCASLGTTNRNRYYLFSIIMLLTLGVGNASGEEVTETITMKNFGGLTTGSLIYQTKPGTSDKGTGMVAFAFHPTTGQVRGNQTGIVGASVTTDHKSHNWSLYNSDPMAGVIKAIKVTQTATGTNKFQKKLYVSLGTSSQGEVTAVTNAQEQDAGGTAQEINFTIDPSKGYTYFKLLSNEKFTSGTVAGVIVTVTYETTSATPDPVDPTVTFSDGNYTVGGTLNLSTLWTSNSDGAVTYTVKTDGGTGATINGTSFTATAEGTCEVKASQVATSAYNAIEKTATITVTAPTPATVSLSEAGAVTNVTDKNVGDSYELPLTSTQTCGTKTFVGWSTVEIATPGDKPTSNFYEPGTTVTLAAEQTFYAVYATEEEGNGNAFSLGQSGDFKIFANVEGDSYYAKSLNDGKISSTTNESDATAYTLTLKSQSGGTYIYTIKQGSNYIAYNSSTNLKTQTTEYEWTISSATHGSWQIISRATASRGIIYRSNTYYVFGAYSTGNVNGTEYFNVEIGGGSAASYTDYTTTCSGSTEPVASLTTNPTTIDFGTVYEGATVADQTVAVNFANLTGDVTYSGLSTPFTATGAVSATGDKITISADASTIGDYLQTLTIASTADSKTAEVTVKMNVVEKPAPTGTFTLHTGELIEGDYVIYYSGKAMKAEVASNRLQYVEVTPSNNEIVDPDAAAIWHIAKSGANWTVYNNNKGYAAGTGTKSQADLVANLTGDNANKAAWTITTSDNAYEFANVWNTSKAVNATLRNNGTFGFACYATSTGGALSLYRKAGTKYNVNISATTNGTVTADPTSAEAGTTITLTVTPAGGYVLDALTVTDASSNPVTVTDNKFTMPASDVTVTATFKENEKPAATLTLSKNGETEDITGNKQDDVVTLPTTVDTDCVKEFVGWSDDANCATEPEYAPGASYTLASTSQTLYAVYATVQGGGEATSEDLFENNGTYNSTAGTITWELANVVSILQEKSNASAPVADYVEDPRWYKDHLITITPSANIKEIVVKAQSNDYATALASSTYTNATATANGDVVTITPTDGNEKITIKMGAQARLSTLTVTYAATAIYSDYSTTCAAALANPTFSLAEGKYTEAKSVEIEYTEGTIYYTTDGTTPTASSTQYTGAIALNDCGEYTIKAIAISADSQSDVVSATYTIKLPLTNSQATPYTETEAIAVYDGDCYDNQEVYVKGTVKTASFYSASGTYTITLTNGFQFYKFYKDGSKTLFEDGEINKGDVLVACGRLSKYNTTYQLAEGCYLVEHEPYTEPKTDISNTEATAYTVDKAFELIADPSSDLTKEVYVKGLVAVAPTSNPTADGQMTYKISDNGENTGNVLTVYLGLNLNGEKFTSKEDVKLGDYVVVKGQLYDYNSTYELNKGNQLVEHIPAATITIADITMEVGETKAIDATITPAAAKTAVVYTIKENTDNAISLSGNNTISADAVGTATITATIATAAEYMGKTVEFTVTVNAKSTKEKVVILAQYEGQWYAMKAQYVTGKTSHLAPLPVNYVGGKLYNVNEADKALIEWELAVVEGKATFYNDGKYLTGKSDDTDLTLAATACEWTISGDSYLIGARTFLYNAQNNWFRNFGTSNAGNKNYSEMPTVTAPVYETGAAYGRTVTTGEYGTICIPYGSSNYTGAEFYEISWMEMDGTTPKGIWLDQVNGALTAGKPYIFKATADEIAIVGDGTTAATPVEGVAGLTGTFTLIQDIETSDPSNTLEGNYMISGNQFLLCPAGCWLNANRAYIDATIIAGHITKKAEIPGRRRVCMGENVETGVEDIITTDAPVKVIENGQLIIIRDGVKYNVQGQVIR